MQSWSSPTGSASCHQFANGASITTTMLRVNLDHADSTPLHEQVAAQLRRAIADESLEAGQRLPPARDLAAALGINANTVLRGMRRLRDEGLLEFRRGRGVSVVGRPEESELYELVRTLLKVAARHGRTASEVVDLIREAS